METAVRHSVSSPDGSLVATLQRTRLVVRSALTNLTVGTWSLSQNFVSKCILVRWSRHTNEQLAKYGASGQQSSLRLLLADPDNVRVFDIDDPIWQASINNASSNIGQIANAVFGHSSDEVLVFSDFGVKVTMWSLVTNRGAEVKDPKDAFSCFDIRPGTGHIALITRATAQDALLLLKPRTNELLKSVDLSTVDAQEVRWSRDGRWIAIKDIASAGHRVEIYTSDGNLYRIFNGLQDTNQIELGVKSIEWSESGTLLVGDFNGRVTLLSRTTFTPMKTMEHTTPIHLPGVEIWEEQVKGGKERSYALAAHPATPPPSSSFTKAVPPKQGISIMAFNADQTMLVTRSDAVPTTAWIWSMKTLKPITVLIHHSPIRQLSWHPTQPDLLLLHCAISEPIVHLWKSNWSCPLAIPLPLGNAIGKLEASWLQSDSMETYNILLSSQNCSTISQIFAAGELVPQTEAPEIEARELDAGAEELFDEGNSLDLSPIRFDGTMGYRSLNDIGGSTFGATEQGVDDTFRYRRQAQAT